MKFLAAVARRDANGLLSSCRPSTPARDGFGFPRSHRLTKEADLEAVRRTGKRMHTDHLEARAAASLLLNPRIGVVVPKYKQRIIARNRLKRRLRELARTQLLPALGQLDLLIRAKPGAYRSTFAELTSDIESIARWADSLCQAP
ncbi:MAG TPA: ribonuclease P protein component [Gemmatimonadaceae bacterium]|nr:ribonuclease P protein component [Gemmatimonadaceae bacterium]